MEDAHTSEEVPDSHALEQNLFDVWPVTTSSIENLRYDLNSKKSTHNTDYFTGQLDIFRRSICSC